MLSLCSPFIGDFRDLDKHILHILVNRIIITSLKYNVSTHCMAVPFSFLSRGYRESLHQKNYYSLLLLIGNSDI